MSDEVVAADPTKTSALNPLSLLRKLLWLFLRLIRGSLDAIAAWVRSMLKAQFSITLQVSSVVICAVFLVLGIWALIRYRFLTNYSRLPSDSDDERNAADMWLEDDDGPPMPTKPSYTVYFDEFLSAIQVFGYLDRKVFHELTRHMRTYRIDAGESVRLKDLDGFAVVIEGSVEVYTTNSDSATAIGAQNELPPYRLLNVVNRAAPISSLFSILALFTSDVSLNESLRGGASLAADGTVPDLDLNETGAGVAGASFATQQKPSDFEQFNEDVFAVGKVDTTIAVIPSEAFRLLTRKYPTQTANIIQVILLRWSRVTVRTSQNYLDLTSQIFDPERSLNQLARRKLPNWLRDVAVQRLRAQAKDEPKARVFYLERRKKGSAHGNSDFSVDYHVNPRYPGDLISSVPISQDESMFPFINKEFSTHAGSAFARKASIETLIPLRNSSVDSLASIRHSAIGRPTSNGNSSERPDLRASRQGSFIIPADFSGNFPFPISKDSEDAVLRKALIEEIFSILGFDSTMDIGHTSSRENSIMGSVPNSPAALPRSGVGMNLSSIFNDRRTPSENFSTDEATSVVNTITYESLVEQAADSLQIILYKEGELLSRENKSTEGIFYVLEGTITLQHTAGSIKKTLYDINPGGIAGYIETVTSYSAFTSIYAKTDVYVAKISKSVFDKLADRYPLLSISVAKTMLTMLSRPIIHLDFALEWLNIKSGETLYRQGEESDAIFFVLNGRVRLLKGDDRSKKLDAVGEFGQGSSLGQLETLLGGRYQSSAIAVRETELVRFPSVLVESLAQIFPKSTFEMAKIVAFEAASRIDTALLGPSQNIRTVTIFPTADGLPVQDFAARLAAAYREHGRDIALLSNATALSYLGKYAFSRIGILKLKAHLAGLEQQHETVIYVADTAAKSQWSRTCVDQADCILLLADAASPPAFGDYERLLVKSKSSARAHLVLLHQERFVEPGSTGRWLKNRPWVTRHHHVQMDFKSAETRQPPKRERLNTKSIQKLKEIRDKVQGEIFKDRKRKPIIVADHNKYRFKNDFGRIARILSGDSIGLVLGGGGARGLAHVGVLRALEEMGVPIDMVGGTSIGSFVGGLYARDYDNVQTYGRAKQFSARMSSLWSMLFDVTYPALAYTTGHAFNRGIWKIFGDSRIEDFWVKYFNNTTNLTHSRMDIHQTGYAWRFIRASMSLAGLVPPIEDKGQMLLDGGYMDNLPVTEMLKLGARHVIAVDVGSVDETTLVHYGDTLSGLWVLFNRWNPFSSAPRVPNLAEVQARLAYVSSVKALEVAKTTDRVLYLRPPIDSYATLDFGKYEEIVAVGHTYAVRALRQLSAENKLPSVFGENDKKGPRPMRFRRHSI